MPHMHVNAAELNIRTTPEIKPGNIVAKIPFAHPLETAGLPDGNRWIKTKSKFNGKTFRGYVNVGYLRAPLSIAKENLLAAASKAWSNNDLSFAFPDGQFGFALELPSTAKPAIGDLICCAGNELVVARGMTQVWAINSNLEFTKHPLLENGQLDNQRGVVTAVLRNLR